VQVAGVRDAAEGELLVSCGVDFVGIPLRLDHHAGDCTEAEAGAIVAALAGRAQGVLITYLRRPREIARLARALGVGWVQLHGAIDPADVAALRALAPGLRLTKSLVVRGDLAALEREMDAHAAHVDAFLTDSFDPATGAKGATGRTHDWSISRALALRSPRPLVLAGGLGPGNVREAILAVRPAAVDAHTGVEGADGRKDRGRVERFVAEARAGFQAAGIR
jgi:phosphoribosylanthranilate isomerase